jgi:hypothetical protein
MSTLHHPEWSDQGSFHAWISKNISYMIYHVFIDICVEPCYTNLEFELKTCNMFYMQATLIKHSCLIAFGKKSSQATQHVPHHIKSARFPWVAMISSFEIHSGQKIREIRFSRICGSNQVWQRCSLGTRKSKYVKITISRIMDPQ